MSGRDVRVNVDLRDLGDTLRALYPKIRASVLKASAECALRIVAQVQVEIDETDVPGPPVNTGAYAAAWRWRRTKDGAIVFNATPQAEWIERGRNAGPISKEGQEALRLWIKRKGLHVGLAVMLQNKAHQKAVAAYLGATMAGVRARKPRDPNARKPSSELNAKGWQKKARKRSPAGASFLEEALDQLTFVIAQSIAEHGYPARFPLWRAVRALEKELESIYLAAILDGLRAAGASTRKPRRS